MNDMNQVDVFVFLDVEAEKLRVSVASCLDIREDRVHVSSSLEEWEKAAIVNVQYYRVKGDFRTQLSIYGVSYAQIADALPSLSKALGSALFLPSRFEQSLNGTYVALDKAPIQMALEESELEGETEYRLRMPK